MDKLEGEPLAKAKRAGEGNGMQGYIYVHHWMTETSGIGFTQKYSAVMNPPQSKNDGEVAGNIEKWKEVCKQLESTHG